MEEFGILIHAGKLKELQEEMDGEISKIMDCLLSCKQQMQVLTEGWTGEAAAEFQITFGRIYQELWTQVKAMLETTAYLVTIEETMEEAEKEVQKLWEEQEV